MLKITPSFTFSGQCAQAIELYKKAFGAKVKVKLLFSDAQPNDFQCSDEEKDYIFHCQLMIGEQMVILSDDSGKMLNDDVQSKTGKTYLQNLLISFRSDDDLQAAYSALEDGATIVIPMKRTAYAQNYVFLVDRYGGRWELMSQSQK